MWLVIFKIGMANVRAIQGIYEFIIETLQAEMKSSDSSEFTYIYCQCNNSNSLNDWKLDKTGWMTTWVCIASTVSH